MQHFRGESEERERADTPPPHGGSRNESYLRPHASIRLILDSARYNTHMYGRIQTHTQTHERTHAIRTRPSLSRTRRCMYV